MTVADQRGFMKLAHGFPEHPKVDAVGGDAAWLYVCALAYCSRNLTDGLIPVGMIARLSDRENPHELASKLVEVGLWHSPSNSCERCGEVPSDKRLIHDYLEHQQSAVKVREISQKRAVAGQKGGQAKAANAATSSKVPSNLPSKPLADLDLDVDLDLDLDLDPKNPSSSPAAPGDGQTTGSKPKKTKGDEPIEPERFERFWALYPKKVAKGAAVKAWNTALRRGTDPQRIINALEFYVMERRGQDPTYTKHPATWLNAACWQDEPDPAYVPPPVVAHSNGHNGRNGNDYGSDAHLTRYLERAAARKANGGGW